jgi:hypothetical protein
MAANALPTMGLVRLKGAVATVALAVLAGCGSDDAPATPSACLEPASGYLAALRAAPAEVRLEGGTPISDCLVEGQSGGQLAQVGQAMVGAATELNAAVRSGNDDAPLQLGYLVGAVQEAASTTSGIHEDLTLRLDAAANFTPNGKPFPASVERTLNQGYAAGQQYG